MESNFGKFAFLTVVILAVLFSHLSYQNGAGVGLAGVGVKASAGKPIPLFAMPSVAISAADGGLTANGTGPTTVATSDTPSIFSRTNLNPPPALNDAASLVADLTTGAVFESSNPDKRWPTASLTKLMTATIALDHMTPETRITITEPMFAVDPTDETTLTLGGTYTLSDLLYVLLLPSSNIAAEAIADFYGHDAFIGEMNSRAAAWDMQNTFFGDPSGLSATNQSTANDFLKLAQVIYNKYPSILAITRNDQVSITEQNSNKKVPVKSINDFAGQPDFIGGKTGHTDQADGNLFSIFSYDGHPIFIVVLGTNNRFMDTEKLYAWFKANYK